MEREGSIRNAVVTVSKNRDITARKMWYRDHFLIGKDAIHLRNENSDILPGARSWPTYEYLLNTISGHFCEIVCIPAHSGVTYFFVIFARWFYSLPSRGDGGGGGGEGYNMKNFCETSFPRRHYPPLSPIPRDEIWKYREGVDGPKLKSFVVWENCVASVRIFRFRS